MKNNHSTRYVFFIFYLKQVINNEVIKDVVIQNFGHNTQKSVYSIPLKKCRYF